MPERVIALRRELPRATVERLVRCHRYCSRLVAEGRETVSSQELSKDLGCSSSMVRRDLSSFGRLGTRGWGYRVEDLQDLLGRVIGKERRWNVILVGAGHLGTALMGYEEFRRQGFHFVAVFDGDPAKVGAKIGSHVVRSVSEIPGTLKSLDVDIAVLAVPTEGAQLMADLLVDRGVGAILSFSRVKLSRRRRAAIINIDLTTELQKLAFHLSHAERGGDFLEAVLGELRAGEG